MRYTRNIHYLNNLVRKCKAEYRRSVDELEQLQFTDKFLEIRKFE